METRLALYLLGPPRIERDGVPVKLDRRKAVALLAYLAVTGERQRRDSLVNLLWPEYDGTRGRAALRRTLYTLRNALPGGWLEVDREEVGLASGLDPSAALGETLWLDVVEFRRRLAECETHGHPTTQVCAACVVPLSEAVGLARADFLSGFGLKDSFNFDDWQLFQAEALRRELADALGRLVSWHSREREFEPAVGYARRRLALDPLDEAMHCQLMRLYAWSGRRSAALRQYADCVTVLEEQLGVAPGDTTRELYQAIQDGRPPPPPEERGEPTVPLPAGGLDLGTAPPSFLEGEVAVAVQIPFFVAREQELAQLDGHLDLAVAGPGRVVFVTGDAGSGKTSLVQEFTRRAQEDHAGLIAASGNCNAYTGIGDPYLPFREVLGLLTGDVEAQWAAGAMSREQARRLWDTLPFAAQALVESGPDLLDTFVPRAALLDRAMTYAPSGADWLTGLGEFVERRSAGPGTLRLQQSDLFEQYTRVLQALAQRGPLLLVVDDLQWADLGSISLLFHLGRHLAGCRILIVGAYRPEEVAIERDGERHPLEPVVNEFGRDFGDITVNLGQAQGWDLVEALLDSEPNCLNDAFRQMLFRQTRGHPLFTAELLRGLQERGDLVQDPEDRWVEGPALDWETLPARVEAVIAERIGRLARPLRAALCVASVEGETFTAEVVARVQAADRREVVGSLSGELDRKHRLVRAQAIERLGPRRVSRYRFRNYLFQRYLYDSLDQVERAYLHEDVGNALEALYGEQSSETSSAAAIAPQLARHFQEAGRAEKAIHYLHQAGDRAVQLSAYQEGVAHLTRGLDLLMDLPDPGDAERRLERAQQELALQISLGMAWKGRIPGPEGEIALTRARELCQQTGETTQLCQVFGELLIIPYVRGEYQTAHDLAEEALSVAQQAGDPLLVALGHWQLGFILFGMGEYTSAHSHLQEVLSFYEPQAHHHSFVFLRGSDAGASALAYDACCLWCLGFPDQAAKHSQEALALARELDHPFTLADVLCYGGCAFNKMRPDAKALEVNALELMRLSEGMGFSSFWGTGTSYWGEALTRQGQVQEGIAQLREGMALRQSMGVRCASSGILIALAWAQSQAGQPEGGLTTLDEALALVEETGERYSEAELYRLRAELLLMQGDDVEAEASLQKAIAVARRQRARSWELRATTSLARLWQKQGRVDDGRRVLSEVYEWFSEGLNTPDLRDARALLEELGHEATPVVDL